MIIKNASSKALRGGRPGESWVFLTAPGRIFIEDAKGKASEVNLGPDYWTRVAAETNRALKNFELRAAAAGTKPYRFPVTREHLKIGRREGDILEVRFGELGGKVGLWALTSWTPRAWMDISAHRIQHVSLGVQPKYTDEAGVQYGPLLWEFAVTSHPVNKEIGTIQETLALQWAEGDVKMDPEALMAALAEVLNESLAQLRAGIVEDMKMLMEEAPAPPAEPAPPEAPAPQEAEQPVEQSEPADQVTKIISEFEAKLDKKLNALSLNMSERGGTANKTTPAPQGPSMDAIKKQGLSGVAAATEYLRQMRGEK